MNFRIANTFRDSPAKLTGNEQKTAKTTVFDLQMDPSHPGLKFHRLDKTKDPNFRSVRVSGDLRIIVHKTKADILICYIDHHDKAYAWAERRRLEKHPKIGADSAFSPTRRNSPWLWNTPRSSGRSSFTRPGSATSSRTTTAPPASPVPPGRARRSSPASPVPPGRAKRSSPSAGRSTAKSSTRERSEPNWHGRPAGASIRPPRPP